MGVLQPFSRILLNSANGLQLQANGFKTLSKCAWTCWKHRMEPHSVEWVLIRANASSIRPNSRPKLRDFVSSQTKLRGLLGHFTPFVPQLINTPLYLNKPHAQFKCLCASFQNIILLFLFFTFCPSLDLLFFIYVFIYFHVTSFM